MEKIKEIIEWVKNFIIKIPTIYDHWWGYALTIFVICIILTMLHFNRVTSDRYINKQESKAKVRADKGKRKVGNEFENFVASQLSSLYGVRVLRNLIFPIGDGTTEMDMLFINQKGVFCVECKHHNPVPKYAYAYMGLAGESNDKKWYYNYSTPIPQEMIDKEQLSNPLWQNERHIRALKAIVPDIVTYNMVCVNGQFTFYNTKLGLMGKDPFFCAPDKTHEIVVRVDDNNKGINKYKINRLMEQMPDVYTKQQVREIYSMIESRQANKEQRRMHEQYVKAAHVDEDDMIIH